MDKLPADFAKTEGRTFSRLKNECLARIDRDVQATVPDIGIQMGVIMMAQVLAFRRLLNYHGVTGRGQRLKLVKAAVAEFDQRLREYSVAPQAPTHDDLGSNDNGRVPDQTG